METIVLDGFVHRHYLGSKLITCMKETRTVGDTHWTFKVDSPDYFAVSWQRGTNGFNDVGDEIKFKSLDEMNNYLKLNGLDFEIEVINVEGFPTKPKSKGLNAGWDFLGEMIIDSILHFIDSDLN